MATIQFELERLYDLVKETQEERDKLKAEVSQLNDNLNSSRVLLQEQYNKMEDMKYKYNYVQNENYALNHRLECLIEVNRTTHEYLKKIRNENKALSMQLDQLTDGTIKYKRVVDPDDLEEYPVGHKIYLRDLLTDAIYTRQGRLMGYIHEDTGKFVQIMKKV